MGGLFNRRADLWRPLLAIADEAGANGPTWRARPKPRSGQLPTTTRAASVSNCFATVRDVFGEWKADQTRAGVAPAAMAEIERGNREAAGGYGRPAVGGPARTAPRSAHDDEAGPVAAPGRCAIGRRGGRERATP